MSSLPEPDVPFNAANPDSVKQRKSAEKRLSDQRAQDLVQLMSQPWGRRWMYRHLGDCGLFKTSFHPSSQIYFNEGQRNIALSLWSELERVCPHLAWEMMKEHYGNPG